VDNPAIMVDYSETTGVIPIVNDFHLIIFPDSPLKVAVCITVCAGIDNTFAAEKTATMELRNQNHEDIATAVKANLIQIIQENSRLAEGIDYSNSGELISHIKHRLPSFLLLQAVPALRCVQLRCA
jgi:hypothetical protein